jgi:hypothetical protein
MKTENICVLQTWGGGGIVHFFNFCGLLEICRKEDCHAFADFPHWKIVFFLSQSLNIKQKNSCAKNYIRTPATNIAIHGNKTIVL